MISRQTFRLVLITAFVLISVPLFDRTATSALAARAPTAPTNLSVTAVTESTISLSWNASTHNRPFSYRLRLINQNNPQYNTLVTVSQSQTSYTLRFLPYNSTFSITVYAVDDRGHQSADSNTVTASTPADETPPSVPTLETTVLGPSQVRLSWTRSTDNIPLNCCSYRFLINDVPLTQHLNWFSETGLVVRHLTPGSTNTFKVTATDYAGNTSTSNASTAITDPSSDTVAPTAPTNLHLVRDQGCGEVTLGWTQAIDDVDPQFAIEYEIYVNGVLSPLAVSAGVSEDFVYATAFGDNTFSVKAVDRTGNSSEPSKPLTLSLWPC